jgi:hypothetical protein
MVVGNSQSYGPNLGITATLPALATADTFNGLEYVLKLGPSVGSHDGLTLVTTKSVLVGLKEKGLGIFTNL